MLFFLNSDMWKKMNKGEQKFVIVYPSILYFEKKMNNGEHKHFIESSEISLCLFDFEFIVLDNKYGKSSYFDPNFRKFVSNCDLNFEKSQILIQYLDEFLHHLLVFYHVMLGIKWLNIVHSENFWMKIFHNFYNNYWFMNTICWA